MLEDNMFDLEYGNFVCNVILYDNIYELVITSMILEWSGRKIITLESFVNKESGLGLFVNGKLTIFAIETFRINLFFLWEMFVKWIHHACGSIVKYNSKNAKGKMKFVDALDEQEVFEPYLVVTSWNLVIDEVYSIEVLRDYIYVALSRRKGIEKLSLVQVLDAWNADLETAGLFYLCPS